MRHARRVSKDALAVAVTALILARCPFPSRAGAEDAETVDRTAPVEIAEIKAPFPMPQLTRPEFPNRTFDIRAYGAKGDGRTKNTAVFEQAIEACSAAGGGRVLVPAGKWLTGAIHLRSNVNLRFEEGAELHFSDRPEDYLPVVFTRWAGFELRNYSPLIYANGCENIAITGPGKLFGHGKGWWSWKEAGEGTALHVYQDQILKAVPAQERVYGTPEAGLRPQFISPINCKNVLLEGFSIVEPGPFWSIQLVYCENVIVRRLHLQTVGGPNTDGINLDSCRNALIEYCHVNAGDDAVALKSGMNEEGRWIARPTENVVVRHVTALRCHGGIVIGSDMSGGIRNVYAHDCHYKGSLKGIRLKSNASRGGTVEKIWYENIRMENIGQEAIRINTNYGAYMASKNGDSYPVFRDITFRNVSCDGAGVAVSVQGTSQKPVENLLLEDVDLKTTHGMTFDRVDGLVLRDAKCEPARGEPFVFRDCTRVVKE